MELPHPIPNFIADHHVATAAASAGNTHLFVQIRINNEPPVPRKHLLIDLKPLENGLNFLQPSQSTIPSSVFILSYADGVVLGSVRLGNEVRHVLCNPCIHRYVVLPEPLSPNFWKLVGFGFVPSNNDIGVVKIIHNHRRFQFPPVVKVCYARERVWKTIAAGLASTYLPSRFPNQNCCTNGCVHWVVQSRYENYWRAPCFSEHLLVFDFEREIFETLDLPGGLVKDMRWQHSTITLLLFKQNLSVLFHGSKNYSLWSLAAYSDASSWAKLWSLDTVMEVLYSVFVGGRADSNLIVSRDKKGIMRVYDPDVGSSKESYVFSFSAWCTHYIWGFDESLFLLDDEMQALPLTEIQGTLPD